MQVAIATLRVAIYTLVNGMGDYIRFSRVQSDSGNGMEQNSAFFSLGIMTCCGNNDRGEQGFSQFRKSNLVSQQANARSNTSLGENKKTKNVAPLYIILTQWIGTQPTFTLESLDHE